jgi:serine/threonine-protein kinase
MTQAIPIANWGPLRLLERLGDGHWGQVYRAYDPKLQTEVALKLVRPDRAGGSEARDFLAEARKLARIRHPSVVTVHGVDEHDGRAGIWMDFVRGKTLDDLLGEQGPFSPHEAACVGITLCRALAAVHRAGIVHRDVKAANVMREHGGNIVLMDLGAGAERPAGELELPTEPAAGTPIAMAPEQLHGAPVSPAADIYGLGVLLYRLVTGRYPVEADTWAELLAKHERGERTPLLDLRPDLPAEFVQVVEKALAADPAERYASAGAMERALAGAVGMRVEPAPHPVAAPWWKRMLTWQGQAATATAVVLIAVVSLIVTDIFRRSQQPAEIETGVAQQQMGAPAPAIPDQPMKLPEGSARKAETQVSQPASSAPSKAAALPALTIDPRLFLEEGGTTRRLLPGATVQPGDRLSLELQVSDRVYVYVLNEDATGKVFVLFPVAGLDTQNPLAGGVRHRLPGTRGGEPIAWQVTSAGQRESVILIASREPLLDMEKAIAAFPKAQVDEPIAYGEMNESAQGALLRGMGGMAPSQAPGSSGDAGRLASVLHHLPGTSSSSDGVCAWVIELSNPSAR